MVTDMEDTSTTKARARAQRMISLQIYAFTTILWVVCMACTTMAVAHVMYNSFLLQGQQYAHDTARLLREAYADEAWLAQIKSRPGGLPSLMQRTIGDARWARFGLATPWEWQDGGLFGRPRFGVLRNWGYEFQTAILFTDRDGNILMESTNFVHFSYIPEDAWLAFGEAHGDANDDMLWDPSETGFLEDQAIAGWVQFELGLVERISGTSLPVQMWGSAYRSIDWPLMQITGFLDGAYIHPVKLSYVSRESLNQAFDLALESAQAGVSFTAYYERGTDPVSGTDYESFLAPPHSVLDHAGLLAWQLVFDVTGDVENPEELVTVYGLWPWLDVFAESGPVIVGSEEYPSLLSFLHQYTLTPFMLFNTHPVGVGDRGLRSITVAHAESFTDLSRHDPLSADPWPEPDFIMLTAIHGNPLRHAINTLSLVYWGTLTIAWSVAHTLQHIFSRRSFTKS